jgi:hypothetical protein
MEQQKKGSKAKGRKIGRGKNRPSAKVYLLSKRCDLNRKKKAKRHLRRVAKIAIRKIQYDLRHGRPTDASRLTELRQVIAQNH